MYRKKFYGFGGGFFLLSEAGEKVLSGEKLKRDILLSPIVLTF